MFLLIAFCSPIVLVLAHGDLSERIAQKTTEIADNPKDFNLYYERGLLYQEHKEYTNALEDYLKSKSLGNTNKAVHYSIAEAHYLSEDYNEALKNIGYYQDIDSKDVKGKKLEAQILFRLQLYKRSVEAYRYVVNHMIDIRPEDILEYCDIILAENDENYKGALEAIESGLDKLGPHTLSLQLKKLDYLKASDQIEKALEHYNYFILQYDRKEFWYYKKAKYLADVNRPDEAVISLKLATVAIEKLDSKFKNMTPVIELREQIKELESFLNNPKS